jgi:hypothetical protein
MLATILLGVLAFSVAGALGLPPSRELMIKLGTLVDIARRTNPELFRSRVEPINPFVGKQFKHKFVKPILHVDLTEFGEICQRLQREARKLDVKAHVGLLPIAAYLVGLGLWFALK